MRAWHEQAACRGQDIDIFYHDRTVKGSKRPDNKALGFCNGNNERPPCPVREQCLEFALGFPAEYDMYGIFGGMTGAQRRRIRRGDLRPYKQRGPAPQIITGLDDADLD
jgi:hypothetical protein